MADRYQKQLKIAVFEHPGSPGSPCIGWKLKIRLWECQNHGFHLVDPLKQALASNIKELVAIEYIVPVWVLRLILFPDQYDASLRRLAVLQHCLRLRA